MSKEAYTQESDILSNGNIISHAFSKNNPFVETDNPNQLHRVDGSTVVTTFVETINHKQREYNVSSPIRGIYIISEKKDDGKYLPVEDEKLLRVIAKKIDKKIEKDKDKKPKQFFSFLFKSQSPRYNINQL